MITTWLTSTLGLSAPILGAPMAGRAGGALAAAVTVGGGLGMLGAGHSQSPEFIAEQADVARRSGPFGAGLMNWALESNRASLDAVLAARPAVVLLSFGDPAPYVAEVHAIDALAGAQVNTAEDLALAEAAGVDFVIAQGSEAGGHTGHESTLSVLQATLARTDLPVLAAGGIGSGRGIAAVLAAGAAGAMIGTALLASPETMIDDQVRQRLLAARARDTTYTSVFDRAQGADWPKRWGGRALRNTFIDDATGRSDQELQAAYDRTNPDHVAIYAGEAVELLDRRESATELVRQFAAEAEEFLRDVAGLLSAP